MMNKLKLWLITALWLGAGWAWADPPAQVGRLGYVSGTVSFAPAEASSDWGVALLNRPITSGDRLWSDRDGRAEIRIGSTALRLGALTSVDVLRLDDDGVQLRLAQGALHVHLRQLDVGDNFEISTPEGAVLLTLPGDYRVNVDPAGAATTVVVRRGQADVLTGQTPLSVRSNEMLTLTAQGHETRAVPPPDDFDQWAAARDRREESIVATRYVAPEMTGYEDLDQHGAWHTEPQYGNVWIPAAVPAGWAPYRYGRWVWISPWGWTWVDNAPWGFAPYHYGRWVWLGHRWAWAPGARVARPVYAPALVAFVGGGNWSLSVSSGPAVGWVPLGWREPYIPWYRHSPAYVRNLNVTHVTNINVIQQYSNANNMARIRYVNRDVQSATTVVARDTFVGARQVHDARLNVPAAALTHARVTHEAPVARPQRQSFGASRGGARLPDTVAAREVLSARAPAMPARVAPEGISGQVRPAEDRPRVRVLGTEQDRARERPAEATVRQREPHVRQPAPPQAPAVVQQPAPQRERRDAAPAPAPRVHAVAPPVAAPAPAQAEALRQPQQREHQAREEQQRQARAQAQAQQQQRLQEQKERQQQILQQRSHEVQQQRERQLQRAQQVDQQRQIQRDQRREERDAARRAAQPPQPVPPNPHVAPQQHQRAARGKAQEERTPGNR